jgi:hypothetical protein
MQFPRVRVQLGGLGAGVAEAAADGLDGHPGVESSVAWTWRSWWMPMPIPAVRQ